MVASDPADRAAAHVAAAIAHRDRGSLVDAAAELRLALAHGDRCPDRTRVLVEAAQAQMEMGELGEAESLARTALAEAGEAGDEPVAVLALGVLGQVQKRRGEFATALETARDGRRRAVRLGDRVEQATFTIDESFALEALGDVDGAIRAASEARDIARADGDPLGELKATGRLGALYQEVGRTEEAHATATDGLRRARELGDRKEEAYFALDLGRLLLRTQEQPEAFEAFGTAFLLLAELGAWDTASRLVAEIHLHCTGPRDAELARLAGRAGTLVTLHCGDELGPVAERAAVRAVITAVRLSDVPDAEDHLVGVWGQIAEATDATRPAPAPLLVVAVELIARWLAGERLGEHRGLVDQVDEILGGHDLEDLLAGAP
jgi:tetratricopeptide (TPR) repeat protein